MVRNEDKRLFLRRDMDEEFYCYAVGGARLDARSLDISKGGIFLQTYDELPLGQNVALVFKKSEARTEPIYLVGEVVRHEKGHRIGVGVRWEKAVSYGPAAEMVHFLENVLAIIRAKVTTVILPGKTQPQAVFDFPKYAATGEEMANLREIEDEDTADLSPRRTALKNEQAIRVSGGKKMKIGAEMPAAPKKNFSKSEEEGALTRAITAGETRAPAEVEAAIKFGLRKRKIVVTSMGLKSLFASTAFTPQEQDGDNGVLLFELRVRGGMAKVKLLCTVTTVHDGTEGQPSGYEMSINKVDEGDNPGVYRAYVRWLTFRSISGQE